MNCSTCGKKIRWWQKVIIMTAVESQNTVSIHQKCANGRIFKFSGFRGLDYGVGQGPNKEKP